ncbi:hypothetical protein [Siminovitchia sp. FSL W7-1587]|uniref:hypothetical protein n=1 Tax=Siminovitchia sp. FSL W7-1587 TaxID=2954699 RepID=UPI0030CCDDA7
MKHVIALDVSKGKSSMVIYDGNCQCEFEGELHKRNAIFRFFHFCDPYIFKTGIFMVKFTCTQLQSFLVSRQFKKNWMFACIFLRANCVKTPTFSIEP